MANFSIQMWEPHRQLIIAEHKFYVDQARKRLLSQFGNISEEADVLEKEFLEKVSKNFNPDIHDESEFFELAYHNSAEFYCLLKNMEKDARLIVVLGMFSQWGKTLKDWLLDEFRHFYDGDNVKESVWRADFIKIGDLLKSLGFNAEVIQKYNRLHPMQLVVNVFKHGNGAALNKLVSSNPSFFQNRQFFGSVSHDRMSVSNEDVESFSEKILNFWKTIPSCIPIADESDFPTWFHKAYEKDTKFHGTKNQSRVLTPDSMR